MSAEHADSEQADHGRQPVFGGEEQGNENNRAAQQDFNGSKTDDKVLFSLYVCVEKRR